MRLILARHGNTFGPGDKVVWCGARTDLPLVEKGHRQAEAVGAALKAASIRPAAIICGPLIRTRETAQAIALQTDFDPAAINVAEDLREVDYGTWEARSNDEIRAKFGDEDITNWQTRGIRPANAGWKPDEETIRRNWDKLVAAIKQSYGPGDTIVIVSSNGFFRFVAGALGIDKQRSKMATGAMSAVDVTPDGYDIIFWNRRPDEADLAQ